MKNYFDSFRDLYYKVKYSAQSICCEFVSGWQILACMLAVLSTVSSTTTLSTYLTTDDKAQLTNLFSSAIPFKDTATAYWSLRGLSMLNAIPKDTTVST